jgi:hypothetical protein
MPPCSAKRLWGLKGGSVSAKNLRETCRLDTQVPSALLQEGDKREAPAGMLMPEMGGAGVGFGIPTDETGI